MANEPNRPARDDKMPDESTAAETQATDGAGDSDLATASGTKSGNGNGNGNTSVRERATEAREKARNARPSLIMFLWIIVVWLLLWGELSVGNLVAGLAVALIVSFVFPMPRIPVRRIHINWFSMISLFVVWVWEFSVASVSVAWLAIRRSDPPMSAVVKLKLYTHEELTIASTVTLINLQPGGLVTDIDSSNQEFTMHIMDASSTGRLDHTIDQINHLQARVIKAFESREITLPDESSTIHGQPAEPVAEPSSSDQNEEGTR